MNIVYPLKLDDPADFNGASVLQVTAADLSVNGIFTEHGNHVRRNGYDSSPENGGKGVRITNISGIQNGDLLKDCPHCGNSKAQWHYDPPRTTNERRDQSNCVDCRGQY